MMKDRGSRWREMDGESCRASIHAKGPRNRVRREGRGPGGMMDPCADLGAAMVLDQSPAPAFPVLICRLVCSLLVLKFFQEKSSKIEEAGS